MKLDSGHHLCYCLNVFPAYTLAEFCAIILKFSKALRHELNLTKEVPVAVGLWLPAALAKSLIQNDFMFDIFQKTLKECNVYVPSMNAFPYGDFHHHPVKQNVYRPNWTEESRLDYTLSCIEILARILPEGMSGTISTLPGGYRSDLSTADLSLIFSNLIEVSRGILACGRSIRLAIEPEPGCLWETAAGFEVFHAQLPEDVRPLIGLCHDCAHAAVMNSFLPDAPFYPVPKIHLSSALGMESFLWKNHGFDLFRDVIYLHQTRIGSTFYDDIPEEEILSALPDKPAVVHFHLPLFSDKIIPGCQGLKTETERILTEIRHHPARWNWPVLEIETYTWSVLPPSMRSRPLESLIAQEYRWVLEHLTPSGNSL